MHDGWRLVITGCGTSHGNPGWGYPEWWSTDPKDHRRRSGAVLLGPAGEVVLFDAGPDLADQLRDPYKRVSDTQYPVDCLTRCDAVLLTHTHADHCHGLNELRHLNRLMRSQQTDPSIPIYGHADHLAELREMFGYCFSDGRSGGYHLAAPTLQTVAIEDATRFTVGGITIQPFALDHGPSGRVTGYRMGGLAYCTDCKTIPEASYPVIANCDLLVLDMLRAEDHVSHLNWEQAQAVIERVQPKRTVLVHMGYEVQWQDWQARLPAGVEMAYDGWHSAISVHQPWA